MGQRYMRFIKQRLLEQNNSHKKESMGKSERFEKVK